MATIASESYDGSFTRNIVMDFMNIVALAQDLIAEGKLLDATLSDPLFSSPWGQKASIRPIFIKGEKVYQLTFFKENKAFHQNLTIPACQKIMAEMLIAFRQIQLFAPDADWHILHKSKGVSCHRHPPTKKPHIQQHDRQKKHLLPEGIPDPYLIGLGLMSASGKLIAAKTHKFRQINRFLELVCHSLDFQQPLHIVDLGCGKAYLTFALYHYLREIQNIEVELTGVDLKADVIAHCQTLAKTLGYDQLHFYQGSIDSFVPHKQVDVVVSLHACDTATDYALAKGVSWGAEYLFAAPCCQHELFSQIESSELKSLFRHGILKERCAALITDAARAELLEAAGYQTQVVEFIDLEHSPKNLLLRAQKKPSPERQKSAWDNYLQLKNALAISPLLEKLLF